jgi:7,8-dihydroneopterin aldolase/epimerase/oxygenase
MGRIDLEGLEFFSYHGYHPEERKLGNKYSVDICVETDLSRASETDKLEFTVDYQKLYVIVRTVMSNPSHLLESMAAKIINQVFQAYPVAELVQVSISKFNPPVGGICNRAKVTLNKKREA